MKILILNDYASIQGGAAQVAISSALGLAQRGYKVTFVYGAGTPDPALTHQNLTYIGLDQFDLLSNTNRMGAAISGIWNKDVYSKLERLLKNFDPDSTIVHFHSWVKSLSISSFPPILERQFSTIVTLHDYFSVCPNGGLYNHPDKAACKVKPMSVSCLASNCDARGYHHKLWRFFRQATYKYANFPNGVSHFITVSEFSEKLLKPHLSCNSTFWRIPNPISTAKTCPTTPSKSQKFTYIGRLSPEKGVSLLTQLNQIPQEQLRIIGTGELEQSLRNQLPGAEFMGWCNHAKIIEKLDDTRALIFPSLLYETQGLVVGEAASRGVPSVVSNVTAARDFVADGETGLLFNSGDASSLEHKLIQLSEDHELVDNLGARAYENYWNNPPTLENHVSDLIQCYKSILNFRQ